MAETRKFKTQYRAALACRVVNLDRVKFNDAVANKLYPCAPSTVGGSARLFTEEDLLPLYYFARLTEWGMPAGRAGRIACDLYDKTRARGVNKDDRLSLLVGTMDEHIMPSKNYDPDHEKKHTRYFGLGRIIFRVEFDVKEACEIIAEGLAYEASIRGEED
jgi:hypothetical protein